MQRSVKVNGTGKNRSSQARCKSSTRDLKCKGYSQSVTELKAIVRSIKLHQSDWNAKRLNLEVKIKGIKSLQLAEGQLTNWCLINDIFQEEEEFLRAAL